MKITLQDPYKSLQPFESEDLTDFVVITGKNGSGKSQLLRLISKKSANAADVVSTRINLIPPVGKVQTEGIIKNNSNPINHEQWKAIVNKKISQLKSLSATKKTLIRYLLELHKDRDLINKTHQTLLSNSEDYLILLSKVYAEMYNQPMPKLNTVSLHHQQNILRGLLTTQNIQSIEFVNAVLAYSHKTEEELTDADFFNVPHHESFIDVNDLFSSQIEVVFYNYAKRRHENSYKFFQKKEYNELNNSINDIEFIKKFPPPWNIINDIFTKNKLNFYFQGIERGDFSKDINIVFKLYKKSSNEPIPFLDLSSGEQVIIGLILKLFVTEYYGENLSFPELILLDEPDAHLHPEMSKLLLDVLENTFVKKYKVKVILTTHSPSTIALSPEKSIYQLKNHKESSLVKISKDKALKILTGFLPTLSIDYRNHKQVFVESPIDANYFRVLHDKLHQEGILENKLYFISNSAGEGNCSQVYSTVNQIRTSGNNTSFGIVDWDLTNTEKDFVFVHGKDERYSIENFLFDPIYVICLLMENKAHNIHSEIGFDVFYNHYLIGEESNETLQEIVKYFFGKFEEKFPAFKKDNEKITVNYFNKKTLLIPKYYLTMRGHDIHSKIKVIFPAYAGKSEKDFQFILLETMGKCFPFVPACSVQLLSKIK